MAKFSDCCHLRQNQKYGRLVPEYSQTICGLQNYWHPQYKWGKKRLITQIIIHMLCSNMGKLYTFTVPVKSLNTPYPFLLISD